MVIAKLIRLCMGIVKSIVKVAAVIIVSLVILSLIPSLPPYIEYNAFNVTPPVPLKGALSINTLLNNAERLHEGALKGPEAFDEDNGVLYTGLHGGEIVKFVDGNIIPVAKFGQPCEGLWEEKKCGRPLGIKFARDNFLYVADAYYGLFKVNVNDGTKIQLVSVNDLIEGKPVKLPNAVDVAEDGTVYWTTSSSDFYLEDGVFDMLADGSGRLLRYDPKKKTNEVLINNLHFANGVVLSSNEEFVLVAETARSRIHRYYLKGPKKGVHDIFLDGLPGLPDNLKSDGHGGFLVPLVLAIDSSNPLIFQSLGPFPSIRRAVSRLLALVELFFWQIDSVYPNYYAKRAIHFIGHFESVHGIGPKRITILHVDENGKIKNSYHSTDGKLEGISEAHWFNGAFYLGSPYNTYVGRVVLDIPELHSKKLPVKEDPIVKKQAQNQGQPKKQEKQPIITEQKAAEPTIKQKHSAEDKKASSSDVPQHKQSAKEEKVPVKQEKKEPSKPVQQPKVQSQTPQQKSGKEEKPSVQQQKPHSQQSKETVSEGKQSAGQQKPQSATPKPPVQQQAPKPAAKRPAETQKSAVPQQKQQQKATEVPKSAAQQQKKQSAEAPKSATPQQKQQQQRQAEVPKSPVPEQKKQQQQAKEVPKPAAQQQKKQSAEASKPAAEQQRQQQQRSAEVPKPAAEQQRQQQQRSAEAPKPAAHQQKLETPDKKVEMKQEKQLNEHKTVPHQKPQVKETKPQGQQQKNSVKQETIPAQQKEQTVKHKPVVQQQKSQPQEDKSPKQQQKPPTQQQKKAPEQQKAANQKEPVKPVSQGQEKKPIHQNSSPQQGQPSGTSHQKPKVQDKTPTKEQHPPK